jgi:hypothetical protein
LKWILPPFSGKLAAEKLTASRIFTFHTFDIILKDGALVELKTRTRFFYGYRRLNPENIPPAFAGWRT